MSQPYSYQPNVNRSVTRKWAEARQVDYGGDDWGDDDDDDDGYDEPAYPPLSQGRRSFTNPPPLNTSHKLSFDRGQEQRVFSASAAQPQQGLPPHQNAPPGDPRFYSQQPAAEPSGRTSIDAFRRDGPRPESRDSNTSARQFPPRKASLGHGDFPDYARSQPAPPVPAPAPQESDPAPRFITPAEIYRRHAEEERKRSQESSRPSMDSIAKDASDRTPKQSIDIDSNRRRQPTLDTVAERRSEYLESPVASPIMPTSHESQQHAAPSQIQRIDTDLPARFPSASSRYTDRPDPISASTAESPFPSRNASQTDPHAPPLPPPSPPPQVGGLPVITRGSSFGSSFFAGDSAADSHTSPHQPDHPPPVPDKDAGESSLQHRPSHGYRTMVTDAFQSENQKLGSPAPTDNSMHRSNTTSTSEISPIFGRSQEPDWDSALAENAKRVNDHDASQGELSHGDFTPPRRLGTNRRDSPSPARRPLSMEAPSIPEPQSAVSMSQDSPAATQDIAREAQLRRPGPAVLVHSRGNSRESLRGEGSGTSHKVSIPSLRNQQSYMSELSERSNQRTASEEWANWSAAQREAHARHGIQDSNPATPGLEPSGMSSPAPQSESLEKNVQSTGPASNEDMKPSAAVSGLPSQRPHMARDESFRPVLPGGWQSSASIQKAATPEPSSMLRPRPGFVNPATRNESTESIPTATAPRSANWRSEYTGVQAQAFAAATAAGDALAGIFNGPSLTSRGGDSEVSSINETDDESASTRQDPTLFTRDFAASTPEQERPAYSDSSAARDFASTRPETSDASQVTPKAHQGPFTGAEKPAPLSTSHPGLKRTGTDSVHADSPTKESERWWSDEEEEAPTAPAPLRTSRMSTIEPTRPPIPHSDSDEPDADQLHSDIVQSLTPKSSNIVPTSIANPGRVSPLRHENQRPTSPPFAAAALAVSPARALQEQNSWGPLAPHSKTVSPDRENLPVLAKAPTQAELTDSDSEQPASTTQPEKDQLSDVVTPSTGLETTRGLNGTPHPQESAPSAPNSFTIGNDLPTLPQIPTATEPEPARSSSVASSEISAPSPIEPPATTVNKPASAHDDEYRLSDTMPSQDRADRALAKDLPKPITATNGTAERSSTPTRTQDAPSPVTPRSMNAARPSFAYDSSRAYPRDKVPFEQIKSMGSAQQRIKAYNDNRDVYTQPVGQLENWLTFMNTPEHADAFAAKPISSASSVSPRPRYQQRDSTGAPSGAKQIQEDGKKLLASASKYGAKAGVLGKGLFSKGKEKFRTASAGQKGSLMGRDQNASLPEVSRTSCTSNSVAPQIPTPSMATPIDESSLSTYFSNPDANVNDRTAAQRVATNPPFSPISEVSTDQLDTTKTLDRAFSAVSEEQSPQSGSTVRPANPTSSPTPKAKQLFEGEKRNSVGAANALSTEHNGDRVPADISESRSMDNRRDSSVSDVSSVSAPDDRRHSLAARTISPPLESQVSRGDQPLPQRQPSRTVSPPAESRRPQHAPSYSTAMASAPLQTKEAEAAQDQEQEPTLPAYTQAASPKPPKIGPGAQIVPVARIRQDQDLPRAEQQRPFSFIGSESLLKTGHGTNHSIDNPGVSTGSPSTAQDTDHTDRPQLTPGGGSRAQNAESPLPSARRNPEDFGRKNQEDFAKLRQQPPPPVPQPQQDGHYRIPGPYGHELRQPKPKTSTPVLQQFMPAQGTAPSNGDVFDDVPTAPSGNAFAAVAAAQRQKQQPEGDAVDAAQARTQHMPGAFPAPPTPAPERERGRSKLSSFFRSRSKSRSRRLQKEQQKEQRPDPRPDANRRNSLFKLGSRSSMNADRQGEPEYDEIADQTTQATARPEAGSRRLSKDLFKNMTFGQQDQPDPGQQPSQPVTTPGGKKKRFSGFFGKPSAKTEQVQAPARVTTLPFNAQQPILEGQTSHSQQTISEGQTFYSQITVPQSPQDVNQFQQGTRYAEGQQHPAMRQQSSQPSQPFRGMSPPAQGYYGGQSDTIGSQQEESYFSRQDHNVPQQQNQYPLSSNTPYERTRVPPGVSPYQNEARTYGYENDMSKQLEAFGTPQHPPQRPDLPRLNTGDQQRTSSPFIPASAPPVPNAYTQSRQNATASPYTHPQSSTLPTLAQAQQAASAYQPPSTRANKDISYGSDYHPTSPQQRFNQTQTQLPQQCFNQTPSEPTKITPRVAALHTRSRSPKLGRRSNDDLNAEYNALSVPHSHTQNQNESPVSGLGTFSSKKVSPVGGIPRSEAEQEKPWAIKLPGDGDATEERETTDPASATSSKAREMRRIMLERSPAVQQQQESRESRPTTVAERFMGLGPVTTTAQPTGMSSGSGLRTGTAIAMTSPKPRNASPSFTLSKNPSLRGQAPRSSTPVDGHAHADAQRDTQAQSQSQSTRGLSVSRKDTNTPVSELRPSFDAAGSGSAIGVSREPSRSDTGRDENADMRAPGVAPPAVPVRTDQPAVPKGVVKALENAGAAPDAPLPASASTRTDEAEAGMTKNTPGDMRATSAHNENRKGNMWNENEEVFEMPGSRPEGYESEEEVVMSATAYPGQEWMPVFERWED